MSDGSLDDGAAAVDEADPVWAFEAVGGSGTASKPQSLAPPQPGEESESERVGWIITFVIPVLLIATPLQVATVAGILGLISVVALIVSLVKGKYLLAIATAVVYSVATLAIASQRDGGDPIPILPTWIAYFLLMMGAWGGSKPRSLWARLMSPS